MARTAALVKTSMWDVGSDFRQLTPDAQRVYLLLLTQSQLTSCGVITYIPERWSRMAAGDTTASIEAAIAELEHGRYVIVDRDTSELLIRTFIKHDQVLDKPNIVKQAQREYKTIESTLLRDHLAGDWPNIFGPDTADGNPSPNPSGNPSLKGSPCARASAPPAHDRATGTYTSTDTYTEVEQGSNAAAANPREPAHTTAAAAGIDITPIIDQLQTWRVGRKLETAARADAVRAKACIDRVLSEPNRRGAPGGFYRALWEDGVIPEPGGGRPQRKPLLQVAESIVVNKGPHMTWPQLLDEIHELERDRGEQLTSEQLDQLSRQHDHQAAGAAA